jgi:hypothetical protein
MPRVFRLVDEAEKRGAPLLGERQPRQVELHQWLGREGWECAAWVSSRPAWLGHRSGMHPPGVASPVVQTTRTGANSSTGFLGSDSPDSWDATGSGRPLPRAYGRCQIVQGGYIPQAVREKAVVNSVTLTP